MTLRFTTGGPSSRLSLPLELGLTPLVRTPRLSDGPTPKPAHGRPLPSIPGGLSSGAAVIAHGLGPATDKVPADGSTPASRPNQQHCRIPLYDIKGAAAPRRAAGAPRSGAPSSPLRAPPPLTPGSSLHLCYRRHLHEVAFSRTRALWVCPGAVVRRWCASRMGDGGRRIRGPTRESPFAGRLTVVLSEH